MSSEEIMPFRKSERSRHQSVKLSGYLCKGLPASLIHPVQNIDASSNSALVLALSTINHADYTAEYVDSLTKVLSLYEPTSYHEAQNDPRWVEAMNKELQALEDNHTWDITTLPPDKKAIGAKWVYKIKYKPDGSVERFKARLVAKGYNQVEGKDYKHTFSPVAKFTTVRSMIAIAAARSWNLHQLDINNAFLHGFLDEEVYMRVPEGYNKAGKGEVCLLKRSLYGLKQASRQWNFELTKFLKRHGFTQSKLDYSLFTKTNSASDYTAILVYVDDLLITGNNEKEISSIKQALDEAFTIKDLGHLRYFLGIEVARSEAGILLNQRKYITDILKDTKMANCKDVSFPLPRGLKLSVDEGDLLEHPEEYRRLVGRLLYLNLTRPDISYSVQQLSQFLSTPRLPHMLAGLHLVRYLKSTIGYGLFYSSTSDMVLTSYCDADWGSCPFTGRSLTGFCIFLGSALISWKTKKQNTVSKSSAESEYRSMSHTAGELVWIEGLLHEFKVDAPLPIILHCDNKAAQHIAANPGAIAIGNVKPSYKNLCTEKMQ